MKIALIQQHSTKDKNDNIERGLKAVEEAASKGAELITFPELSFDFFTPSILIIEKLLIPQSQFLAPQRIYFPKKQKNFKLY